MTGVQLTWVDLPFAASKLAEEAGQSEHWEAFSRSLQTLGRRIWWVQTGVMAISLLGSSMLALATAGRALQLEQSLPPAAILIAIAFVTYAAVPALQGNRRINQYILARLPQIPSSAAFLHDQISSGEWRVRVSVGEKVERDVFRGSLSYLLLMSNGPLRALARTSFYKRYVETLEVRLPSGLIDGTVDASRLLSQILLDNPRYSARKNEAIRKGKQFALDWIRDHPPTRQQLDQFVNQLTTFNLKPGDAGMVRVALKAALWAFVEDEACPIGKALEIGKETVFREYGKFGPTNKASTSWIAKHIGDDTQPVCLAFVAYMQGLNTKANAI